MILIFIIFAKRVKTINSQNKKSRTEMFGFLVD